MYALVLGADPHTVDGAVAVSGPAVGSEQRRGYVPRRSSAGSVHSLVAQVGEPARTASSIDPMRSRRFDRAELDLALRGREFVATHAQLVAMGISASSITRRLAPHGPWNPILPGVVLAHRGTPTRRELQLAALAFVGEDAVITGPHALTAHGLRAAQPTDRVDVLAPMARQRKSKDFVMVERTRYLPEPLLRKGIPYAEPPRALVDACRRTRDLSDVRALVAAAVQSGLVTVEQLWTAIRRAPRPRTAMARAVIREVGEGVRSAAEAVARDVLHTSGLPGPVWNVTLYSADGVVLRTPDAYWPELGLAIEIDSFAWHLSPDSYLRTLSRSRSMVIDGLVVLHFAPVEIRDNPEQFIREVAAAMEIARRRPVPQGIRFRAAA